VKAASNSAAIQVNLEDCNFQNHALFSIVLLFYPHASASGVLRQVVFKLAGVVKIVVQIFT